MLSELKRTCALLDIPYGRASGVVWHDTRHAAVTNLVGAGVPEVVAMSITGHVDPSIFKRYNSGATTCRSRLQSSGTRIWPRGVARQRPSPRSLHGNDAV
jgi:hypothetical protein